MSSHRPADARPLAAAIVLIATGCGDVSIGRCDDSCDRDLPEPVEVTPPAGCGLGSAAFCETFDTSAPGGRGGEIDEARFAFARWGHTCCEMFVRTPAESVATQQEDDGTPVVFWNVPTLCGAPFDGVLPPDDVRVCPAADGGGQLEEVLDDYGGVGMNALMVRQLFDFTDRTGVITFDVDAKRNAGFAGHGWWIELWITEDPAPIPHHDAPTIASYPRNGVGVQVVPRSSTCFQEAAGEVTGTQVGNLFVSRDHALIRQEAGGGECFLTRDGAFNHFEVRLSTDRVEVWVSDADDPASFRQAIAFDDLALPFSTGYVHLEHVHFNASADRLADGSRATRSQTYRWDDVAFDGPRYPPLRAYDVADRLEPLGGADVGLFLGYVLSGGAGVSGPETLTVEGVDLTDAMFALLSFDVQATGGQVIHYRFNDGPEHAFTIPPSLQAQQTRAFSLPAPLDELVAGTNTIVLEVREPACCASVTVGNLDLSIQPRR